MTPTDLPSALVVQADATRLPLADASADLVITSPPYWTQRTYLDQHTTAYPGQLGAELDPTGYLEALWQATAEMARVLKPTGSIFVNLGDKYAAAPGGTPVTARTTGRGGHLARVPRKSLLGLPWRYALGCTDRLGLLLRAELVWHKPNPVPESCRDRVSRAHETWFHLTKTERYYAAADAIREPLAASNPAAGQDRLGRLPRSVWTLPSQPLRLPAWLGVRHYAAFPPAWPRRLIQGFSPPGICTVCGQGRRPALRRLSRRMRGPAITTPLNPDKRHGRGANTLRVVPDLTLDGWVCACTPSTHHPGGPPGSSRLGDTRATGLNPRSTRGNLGRVPRTGPWRQYHLAGWTPPPTTPAVVLDVFGGTGTTAAVARSLGRLGISVDLSHAYSRAAVWRIFHADDADPPAEPSAPAAASPGQLPTPRTPLAFRRRDVSVDGPK